MIQKLNYIGVFLTFRCNLGCDYCLNKQGDFAPRKEIGADKWFEILKDSPTRKDLPISLQGGEPTMYEGFYDLVNSLFMVGKPMDILTNGYFNPKEFISLTLPEMFKRPAPYASIRFSFHKNTDEERLLDTVFMLQEAGYSVGIWGLNHPSMLARNSRMANRCLRLKIDYREKEYLDDKHGTYKYPDAVMGKKGITVECKPSELLFAPDGKLFPCHHYLYAGKNPSPFGPGLPIGNVICPEYGLCNPCDVKLKTNRLQQGGHCSVEITPFHKNCKEY